MLYITHKMNEVFTLADRVTVLRDGQFVASAPRAEITPEQVVRWMVGREIAALQLSAAPDPPSGRSSRSRACRCRARRAAAGRRCAGITFAVRAGEVVGVAGLLGAGRTELLEALFGATPRRPAGRSGSRAAGPLPTTPTRRSRPASPW